MPIDTDSKIKNIDILKKNLDKTDDQYADLLQEQVKLRLAQQDELKSELKSEKKNFNEKTLLRKKIEENEIAILKELEKATRQRLETLRVESKVSGKSATEISFIIEEGAEKLKKELKKTVDSIKKKTSIDQDAVDKTVRNSRRSVQRKVLTGPADAKDVQKKSADATATIVKEETAKENKKFRRLLKHDNQDFNEKFDERIQEINKEISEASKKQEVLFAKLKLEAIKSNIENRQIKLTQRQADQAVVRINDSLKKAEKVAEIQRKKGVIGLLAKKGEESGTFDKLRNFGGKLSNTLEQIDPRLAEFSSGIAGIVGGFSTAVKSISQIPQTIDKAKTLMLTARSFGSVIKNTKGSLYDKLSAGFGYDKVDDKDSLKATAEISKTFSSRQEKLIDIEKRNSELLKKIVDNGDQALANESAKSKEDAVNSKGNNKRNLIRADKKDGTPVKNLKNVSASGLMDKAEEELKSGLFDKAKSYAGTAAKGLAGALGGGLIAKHGLKGVAKVGLKATGGLLKSGAGKIIGKGVGKSVLKKIPLLGAFAGGGFAIDRLMKGDALGAGGELLSGLASIVPGLGTAASVAIDAGLAARDMQKANIDNQPSNNLKPAVKSVSQNEFEKDKEKEKFADLIGLAVAKYLSGGVETVIIQEGNKTGGNSGDRSGRGNLTVKDRRNRPNDRRIAKQKLQQSQSYIKSGSMDGKVGILTSASESGNNPGAISTGRDAGGVSYGSYQISTPSMEAYLKDSKYGAELRAAGPVGSAGFNAKWQELALKNPQEFHDDQHAHVISANVDPMNAALKQKGIDLTNRGRGVQEILHSTGGHMGPNYGSNAIGNALKGKDIGKMSDEQIISAIQDEKANKVDGYWRSSIGIDPSNRQGLLNRFEREKEQAIALSQREKIQMAEKETAKSMEIAKVTAENSSLKTSIASAPASNNSTFVQNSSGNDIIPKVPGGPIDLRNTENAFCRNIDSDFCLVS